jgi:hypothetical protein
MCNAVLHTVNFDPSILPRSGNWGTADDAVLNKVPGTYQNKIPLLTFRHTVNMQRQLHTVSCLLLKPCKLCTSCRLIIRRPLSFLSGVSYQFIPSLWIIPSKNSKPFSNFVFMSIFGFCSDRVNGTSIPWQVQLVLHDTRTTVYNNKNIESNKTYFDWTLWMIFCGIYYISFPFVFYCERL